MWSSIQIGKSGTKRTSFRQRELIWQEVHNYWGLEPNQLCYDIMRLKPPTKPLKVLDVGCGEGKDAVFLARNGYIVEAMDATDHGIEKGRRLADNCGVAVDFFKADIS